MARAGPGFLLAALLTALLLAAGCGGGDDTEPASPTAPAPERTAPETETEREADAPDPVRAPGAAEVQTVATGLEIPWEIAFLPNGSALISERPGRVRLLSAAGRLRAEPVAEIDVHHVGEGGLLGLAVDPEVAENRFVYLYRTTVAGNQVVRYRITEHGLTEDGTVVSGIPQAAIHNGGRIHFHDGALWISTGDAGQAGLAQDTSSLAGKLLRVRDFRGAEAEAEIVTTGHRNPQGFGWHPRTGGMYASEHGPTDNDEVNSIVADANYGWPEAEGPDHPDPFRSPLAVYTPAIAPAGATFVSLPGSEWSGDFLIAGLAGEQIRRLRVDGGAVHIDEPLFRGDFGRLRTVVEGPDGALYALTSNRDGRGSPVEDDDRVLRIVPPAG